MLGRFCGKTTGLLILLFVLSQVAACGQKGKLYLPDEQQSSIVPATLSVTLAVTLLA